MLAAGLTAVAVIMTGLGIFMKIILKSLKATTADQSMKEFAKGGAKGYGKTYLKTDKTDKVDTLIICKTLMMQPHRFVTLYDIGLLQLKNPRRFRQKTVK
jgi:hypothetical protein